MIFLYMSATLQDGYCADDGKRMESCGAYHGKRMESCGADQEKTGEKDYIFFLKRREFLL